MTWEIVYAHADGTFEIRTEQFEGYHVIPGDPLFEAVQAEAEGKTYPEKPVVVFEIPPGPLTRRQMRLGLLSQGITTSQVEAVIGALPEPDRSIAMIEWQDATTYEKEHPLILQVASALGLTPEEVNTLWAAALQM